MAITTQNVTGLINLPNGSIPDQSYVEFTLTGFDTEAAVDATIVGETVTFYLDATGNLDADLWPNDEGVRTTFYNVTVGVYNGNVYRRVGLGRISVPTAMGPYDLNDLLPIAPPDGADVDDYIAQLAAAVAAAENSAVTAVAAASDAETAQALAEAAADAAASYAGAGVSLARVNAAGNDSEAANSAIQLASGARYYPLPFATIQGATAATVAGDVIHVYPGIYTETFALKGGRTYQCDPGVVLANCVLTYDGDTAEGPLDWRGHAQVIRTTEPLSSFNIDDGRDCVLELLGGVRDENYASTFYTIDWNRTNLHLKTGHCSTVLRSLFSADDQWDAQAMLGKSVIEASSVESTYATRNTSSTIYVLIRADRGTTLDVYVDSITTPANEALSIGSLVDPGSAKETTINLKRGRIDTPNQAVLFYSIGADSGSDYVLTLSSGVVVKSGASPMTRTQGAASNPRVEVHGVATASSGPDSTVAGPTTGILQIEGAL